MSVAASDLTDELPLMSSVSEISGTDVENWIKSSKLAHSELHDIEPNEISRSTCEDRLSLNNYYDDQYETKEQPHNEQDSYSNLILHNINDNESIMSNSTNREESLDILSEFATRPVSSEDILENSSFKSEDFDQPPITNVTCPIKDVFIGEFTDENIPLIYCCRQITKSFLLTGFSGQLMSDNLVRVSVKSLALTCLADIFKIYPDVSALSMEKRYSTKVSNINLIEHQQIGDILLYADHHDPQLRGNVRILVAALLKTAVQQNNASYDEWLGKVLDRNQLQQSNLHLDNLITILKKVILLRLTDLEQRGYFPMPFPTLNSW